MIVAVANLDIGAIIIVTVTLVMAGCEIKDRIGGRR